MDSLDGKTPDLIDGFTPEQRLLLGVAGSAPALLASFGWFR
jgi:hypothetical protein